MGKPENRGLKPKVANSVGILWKIILRMHWFAGLT